uniref:Uncharacterized protein n=1 Tax=Arundo donax TaxID=35708 RepID=A0A0A8YNS3_ARUDO
MRAACCYIERMFVSSAAHQIVNCHHPVRK